MSILWVALTNDPATTKALIRKINVNDTLIGLKLRRLADG